MSVDGERELEEPAFLDDGGPSAEIPPFITTTNARELYGLRPDETMSEAIARSKAQKDGAWDEASPFQRS